MRRIVLLAIGVVAGLAPVASGQSHADSLVLDSLRTALQRYKDPFVAIHDGYLSTLACIVIDKASAPGHIPYQPGGMGVHFLNTANIGPVPDPAKPQVLLYEPQGNTLQLVGAEWFIPLATGVKGRPELLHIPFDGPMEGHHPLMPASMSHWDLHVWFYKHNAHGMFNATNPDVRCNGAAYRLVEEAPPLVAVPQ